MSKILFITPYPFGIVPSQRFRFEQYLSHLTESDSHYVIKPLFTEKAFHGIYQSGNLFSKIHSIAISYVQRFALLFRIASFDFVFIHREAAPVGPPILEYVIAKVFGKKIIYDFDDAIWLTDNTGESAFDRLLRCRKKVRSIIKWSYKISCGNRYLADYARQYNPNVVINPTTIDTTRHQPGLKGKHHKKTTIGWTGSYSTLKYLNTILPVLQALEQKYPEIEFLVIADENPNLPLKNVVFRRWNKETEIEDLSAIDIGIMPLPDDPWTRGKCGFKALQYMAMENPAVVSPVGVNAEIVTHGAEGYWCTHYAEWFTHLESLILDPEKRLAMGVLGRKKVVDHYSVSANTANFLSLFQ